MLHRNITVQYAQPCLRVTSVEGSAIGFFFCFCAFELGRWYYLTVPNSVCLLNYRTRVIAVPCPAEALYIQQDNRALIQNNYRLCRIIILLQLCMFRAAGWLKAAERAKLSSLLSRRVRTLVSAPLLTR